MSQYRQNKDFFNSPYLLTEEQMKEPLTVIEDFFSYAHLHQAREILADLLHTALTSDANEYHTGQERSKIICFCNQVEQLFEAAYILSSRKKGTS
jgi:hypothetical protein